MCHLKPLDSSITIVIMFIVLANGHSTTLVNETVRLPKVF